MDGDPTGLERELRTLRPAAPSPGLEARIRGLLAEDSARTAVVQPWPARSRPTGRAGGPWVPVLSAAAALLAVVGVWVCLPRRPAATPVRAAVAQKKVEPAPQVALPGPVYEGTVLVGQRDEGIVAMGTSGVARKVRCRYVDNVQWQNRARGIVLTAGVPREEVMLVPVESY